MWSLLISHKHLKSFIQASGGLIFQFPEVQELIFIVLYIFFVLYDLLQKQRFQTEYKVAVVCGVMSESSWNFGSDFVSRPAGDLDGLIQASPAKNDSCIGRYERQD